MKKRALTAAEVDEQAEEVLHARMLKARTMWRENRKLALALDHHMCRFCTFNVAVEVHHIVARAAGGSDAVKNLITVCPNHHALAHRNLITPAQFAEALALRYSHRARFAHISALMEHIYRVGTTVDPKNKREMRRVMETLLRETRERLSQLYGPEAVNANPDFFPRLPPAGDD